MNNFNDKKWTCRQLFRDIFKLAHLTQGSSEKCQWMLLIDFMGAPLKIWNSGIKDSLISPVDNQNMVKLIVCWPQEFWSPVLIFWTKTKLCKKSKSVINLSILGYFDDGHQAVPKWAEWPFCPSVLRHSGCVTHTPTHLTIKHTSKYHVHSVLHTPTYQIGGHRLLFYVVVFLMTDAFWWRTSVMKIMKLWFDQRMLMLYDLLHLLTHCPHKPNTHVS